jgi:hypothetical protein
VNGVPERVLRHRRNRRANQVTTLHEFYRIAAGIHPAR